MRLLDVDTLELHEFMGSNIPKYQYAILSHTWAEEEVSLQDLQAGSGPSKQGYEKIVLTCEQAKQHGCKWAWVDTCCIDKTSSAELSEAINSMYQWYEESAVCYAYLIDVVDNFPYVFTSNEDGNEPPASRWFTRAWTLQELIAPSDVIFYGRGWAEIGRRYEQRIQDALTHVTGIPESLISIPRSSLSQYSVAQKMSWAAHRLSTRIEDIAYSLLGIFEINMPLLYGEGPKAFVRLQEEILKETDDHSLLCWTVPRSSPRAWSLESVFAKSPNDFADSGDIVGNLYDTGSPSAMTNRGLQIHVELVERHYRVHSHLCSSDAATAVYDAMINASYWSGICVDWVSIILIRTPWKGDHPFRLPFNRYARLAIPTLGRCDSKGPYRLDDLVQIYINKTLLPWEQNRFGSGGVHLQNISLAERIAPLSIASKPQYDVDEFCTGLQIKTVYFSGLQKPLYDATKATKSPTGEITWSPVYGHIKFEFGSRQSLEYPYFVNFAVGPGYGYKRFNLFLIWNNEYIHFGVDSSESSLFDLCQSSNSQAGIILQSMLDPSNPSTHRGNCWEMYGDIARASIPVYGSVWRVPRSVIEFILGREDPYTNDGEAAGNRLHFLIRTEEK
ncbi:HET-domain-containing protein [Daldinia decipiens]|uniref:HET-domain-containing protein n=1 Tax=Daldinia decipiens TaxID=326647 RepID=UPI0020C215CF|nr:HET-domain-containing protein [Daldinia decipiens]KAI1654859.1 HET-domain-containing protein [Daldinia decipiens]